MDEGLVETAYKAIRARVALKSLAAVCAFTVAFMGVWLRVKIPLILQPRNNSR